MNTDPGLSHEDFQPKGAVFFFFMLLVLMVVIWGFFYILALMRA